MKATIKKNKKHLILSFLMVVSIVNKGLIAQKNDLQESQKGISMDLFRKLYIANGTVIKINDKISNYTKTVSMGTKSGVYNLKKGTYGVADSIWLETSSQGLIKSFNFYYNYDTAYVHELKKYQGLFQNEGINRSYTEPGKEIKICTWSDGKTMFELVEIITGVEKKKVVYSTVYNLAGRKKKSYLLEKEISNEI